MFLEDTLHNMNWIWPNC